MPGINQISERGQRWLPRFLFLFMLLQPILDVLGYWQKEIGVMNVVTMTVRALLSAVLLLLGFLRSERKWIYLGCFGLSLLYLAGHALACANSTGGYQDFLEDLVEQARIFFLPVTALCLVTLLRREPEALGALLNGMTVDLWIICAVALLSRITGTDPTTYPNQQVGVLGWFLWANSQSAILGLLCPLTVAWTWKRTGGRLLPVAAASLLSFAALWLLGTRLALAALAVTGLCLSLSLFLQGRSNRRCAAALLLLTLLCAGLIPWSPMVRARTMQSENASQKQALIDEAVSPYIPAGTRRTENPEALRAAYSFFLNGLVDRFGLERVAEQYDYSLDQSVIWDRRRMLLTGCHLLMEDSHPASRWFGLELGKMRQDTRSYNFTEGRWGEITQTLDPENDFLGVWYLCGFVGLAAICALLAFAAIRACRGLLSERRFPDPLRAGFLLAYGIGLAHACFTVSTLRRNNASVYFAVVLAVLLSERLHAGGQPTAAKGEPT